MALLKAEFPELEMVEIPGYGIRYSAKKGQLVRGLIFQVPRILQQIRRENAWLKNFCRNRKIDAIISDNRYGFYHRKIFSVFITHQLFIQTGMGNRMNRFLMRLNYFFIQRFAACWVPDFQYTASLAGLLSHPPRLPGITVKYIGILSRFQPDGKEVSNPLLILISGPEPQRTEWEHIIFEELNTYKGRAVVVRGLPDVKERKTMSNPGIVIYNHLPSEALNEWMNCSEIVICRSGYSSIMDLARLRKKALLIPTPGQPEQEYLARTLDEKKWALQVSQASFRLEESLKIVQETAVGFPAFSDEESADPVLVEFLGAIQ
jgi:UDP-N-acetylglucosamine transferase subunit ALG13